ncbi:MAG TPA: hybrid sensor histidine kinase/response regulator, partial [Kofleriaceae bacterium]|nr:hybrid sensor histidine kinase/response regulator [Kofleriaceae bacterium]
MTAAGRLRILLVEDEPGYARFLREVLLAEETRDHEVTWVATLEDAGARLAEAPFDLVLLDLGLPDADGVEALTAVSAQAPSSAIVVLSSMGDLELALRSVRLGAQEYLVKGQSEHLLLPRALRHAVERKRLQDAADIARAEAERASAAKDEFLAMLGHELRNPLAPIVTALAIIRDREPKGIDRELTILERQVDSVVRLVDDLLDVSRITRGKMELHPVDVDLADVVADAVETTRPLFDRRRHRLDVEVPHGTWVVHGDRVRLAQVVANLLSNAAKYTEPGGHVRVTASDRGGSVSLCVRDNGIGMAPALLARAFGLFEQGPQSLDRSIGGLGLGLAIVKNLVTMHGGTVVAESEGLGHGSALTVTLPL